MTTAREREAILTEYGEWVEQKTLIGLDLGVEAYLDDIKAEENAELVEALRMEVGNYLELDRSADDDRQFLRRLHDALFPEWKDNAIELDRS